MKRTTRYYQSITLLASLLLLVLIALQINWLNRAIGIQKEGLNKSLLNLAPDIALAFNAIDHPAFHRTELDLDHITVAQLQHLLDSVLMNNDLDLQPVFAIYQDSTAGFFKSNTNLYEEELQRSELRACISCITSFSIVKDAKRLPNETEEAYAERMMESSEFQYFSPVIPPKGQPKERQLWVSLYLPKATAVAFQALIYLFIINVLLLLMVLVLFYQLLFALNRHKQLAQVKNDFFNNMTHEFKTPLSSIRLASRVLRQNKDEAKGKVYHELIERETTRLEKQVDQLLQLSLLDQQAIELESESVQLGSVLAEIPKRMRALLEQKGAELEIESSLDHQAIKGDFQHLANSICNLVENSLKYATEKVKIKVFAYEQHQKIRIHVRDNGPGIPKEFREKIFDRFFRAQKSDQYKGTGFGIGLSYVKHVIEAHQGSIRLNSQYKNGCEFIIEL